jgi:emericellamide synthase (highly reducing iterative type I polyketide synthase)
MHSQGVKVLPKACDIASKEAVEAVVRDLRAVDGVGQIRGVINAAMALEVSLPLILENEKQVTYRA